MLSIFVEKVFRIHRASQGKFFYLYKLQVEISGELVKEMGSPNFGKIYPFKEIQLIIERILFPRVKNIPLNSLLGAPTLENFLCWIQRGLKAKFGNDLIRVSLSKHPEMYRDDVRKEAKPGRLIAKCTWTNNKIIGEKNNV